MSVAELADALWSLTAMGLPWTNKGDSAAAVQVFARRSLGCLKTGELAPKAIARVIGVAASDIARSGVANVAEQKNSRGQHSSSSSREQVAVRCSTSPSWRGDTRRSSETMLMGLPPSDLLNSCKATMVLNDVGVQLSRDFFSALVDAATLLVQPPLPLAPAAPGPPGPCSGGWTQEQALAGITALARPLTQHKTILQDKEEGGVVGGARTRRHKLTSKAVGPLSLDLQSTGTTSELGGGTAKMNMKLPAAVSLASVMRCMADSGHQAQDAWWEIAWKKIESVRDELPPSSTAHLVCALATFCDTSSTSAADVRTWMAAAMTRLAEGQWTPTSMQELAGLMAALHVVGISPPARWLDRLLKQLPGKVGALEGVELVAVLHALSSTASVPKELTTELPPESNSSIQLAVPPTRHLRSCLEPVRPRSGSLPCCKTIPRINETERMGRRSSKDPSWLDSYALATKPLIPDISYQDQVNVLCFLASSKNASGTTILSDGVELPAWPPSVHELIQDCLISLEDKAAELSQNLTVSSQPGTSSSSAAGDHVSIAHSLGELLASLAVLDVVPSDSFLSASKLLAAAVLRPLPAESMVHLLLAIEHMDAKLGSASLADPSELASASSAAQPSQAAAAKLLAELDAYTIRKLPVMDAPQVQVVASVFLRYNQLPSDSLQSALSRKVPEISKDLDIRQVIMLLELFSLASIPRTEAESDSSPKPSSKGVDRRSPTDRNRALSALLAAGTARSALELATLDELAELVAALAQAGGRPDPGWISKWLDASGARLEQYRLDTYPGGTEQYKAVQGLGLVPVSLPLAPKSIAFMLPAMIVLQINPGSTWLSTMLAVVEIAMGLPPPEVDADLAMEQLLQEAAQKLQGLPSQASTRSWGPGPGGLGPRTAASVVYCLCSLGRDVHAKYKNSDKVAFEITTEWLQRYTLWMLLYTLASCGYHPDPAWLLLVPSASYPMLMDPKMTMTSAGMLIYGLAYLGGRPDAPWMTRFCSQTRELLGQDCNVDALTTSVSAVAMIGFTPSPEWLEAVMDALLSVKLTAVPDAQGARLSLLHQVSDQQLTVVVQSLERLTGSPDRVKRSGLKLGQAALDALMTEVLRR
eukprot:gene24535-10139_t